MPIFSKFLAGGSNFMRWCQEYRRRLWLPKALQLPSHSVAESGAPRNDTRSTQRHDVQSFTPSANLGIQSHGRPSLPSSSPVPLKDISPQVDPSTALGGPEPNELAATQPPTFSSIHETPISLPPAPLSQHNQPASVSPISDARPPKKLYFETADLSFLGYVQEPEGRPTFGGGYSDVFRCPVHFCTPSETLPIEVAFKVLRPVYLNPPDQEQRLEQAQVLAGGHNLAHVAKPPEHRPPHWVDLETLSCIHLPMKLYILIGIAKALECLHSRGVIHGDIKLDNILLSDSGEPMLADFGLSRILGEETMYTSSHHGGGSMPWMSPECMMQGVKSCQSDVYSFGSLVFAIMTGKLPYTGLAYGQISVKVCDTNNLNGPVQDWNAYPQLQEPIKNLLLGCWSPSPSARHSMSAVVQRLTALLESSV